MAHEVTAGILQSLSVMVRNRWLFVYVIFAAYIAAITQNQALVTHAGFPFRIANFILVLVFLGVGLLIGKWFSQLNLGIGAIEFARIQGQDLTPAQIKSFQSLLGTCNRFINFSRYVQPALQLLLSGMMVWFSILFFEISITISIPWPLSPPR
jgi:hypothetical protein